MGLIDGRWPLSPRDPVSPAWASLTDDAKDRFDHLMAVYAAMIEAIDTSIGRLVKGLEARGALDNTLILFLSDNGANAETGPDGRFNGDPPGGPNSNLYLGMNWATLGSTPFRRFKHFTHEGGIAVPLIAHWPRGIPARRRNALVREPAHLVDVMPTILEVAGAAYPREFRGQAIQAMEGVSLRPALAGRPLARTQPLFWEHEGNRAVRSGKWKLVSAYPKAWELYDMTADRVERTRSRRQPSRFSSGRSPRHGTRGPREPTWIRGPGHRGSRGATTRRRRALSRKSGLAEPHRTSRPPRWQQIAE